MPEPPDPPFWRDIDFWYTTILVLVIAAVIWWLFTQRGNTIAL